MLKAILVSVSALVGTGEGAEFSVFVVRHPVVLFDILVFSICSAVGQVSDLPVSLRGRRWVVLVWQLCLASENYLAALPE